MYDAMRLAMDHKSEIVVEYDALNELFKPVLIASGIHE